MDTTAVLARTNLQLRVFEQALSEVKVPYYLVGKSGFWGQSEVRHSLDYLAATTFLPNHVISGLLRAPYWPTKFLPKLKLQSRLKELKDQDDSVSYWKLMTTEPHTLVENKNLTALSDFTGFVHGLSRHRDLSPADALKSVLGALKVGDFYSEEDAIDNDPLANIAELLKLAGKYQTIRDFLDFTRKAAAAGKSKKGVALSTVHGFKGLQAHAIYFVGVSEGIIPHTKATDLEEERNIFFVGCSRAERELTLTFSGQPSPFLKNCDIVESKETES